MLRRITRVLSRRLRAATRPDALDEELERELAFHFDQLVSEYEADGMSASEARFAARRALGNVPLLADQCRDERRVGWLQDVRQDLDYSLRVLRRNSAFTLVVVASLALGIGANTAVLGVMDGVLRSGLPIPDDERVVVLRTYPLGSPSQETHASIFEYFWWLDRNRTLDVMSAALGNSADFGAEDDGAPAARISGHTVTPELFALLRVKPHLGRTLSSSDPQPRPGMPGPIVLSHRLWQTRFGGRPDIIGHTVRLGGAVRTVIGVMPAGFHYPAENVDYWLPMRPDRGSPGGPERFYVVNARLKDGVTVQQAQADLDDIAATLARERPESQNGWGVRVVPLREAMYGWTQRPLLTFGAAVGLVLLVACANVAGLLLARGLVREPELALRAALGAGRTRIVRQLLAESLVLSALGGLAGLAVAWAGTRALLAMSPPPGGVGIENAGFDVNLFGAMAIVSLAAGMFFGIVPAILSSRPDVTASLKEGAGSQGARLQPRLRRVLVAVQVGVTFVLVISTGLLARSFLSLITRDLHFDTERLLTFELNRPIGEFMQRRGVVNGLPYFEIQPPPGLLMQRVLEDVAALPGVDAVGASSVPIINSLVVPSAAITLGVSGNHTPASPARAVTIPVGGGDAHLRSDTFSAGHFLVTPGLFAAIGATIVQGREIQPTDTVNGEWVALVNESAARRFWRGQDPVGQRFRIASVPDERPRTVVGVLRDIPLNVRQQEDRPAIYTPYLQQPTHYPLPGANMFGRMVFMLRTTGEPFEILPAVQRVVANIDPDWPLAGVTTMEQRLAGISTPDRPEYVIVLAAFALTAALLAAIGVYGLMSYTVAQRTREIGIRVALGARAHQVMIRISRQGLMLVSAGLAGGAAAAVVLTPLLQSQLWGVTPTDVPTFAAAFALLLLVCVVACLIPARRATSMPPTNALRCE